ncbi:MAG: hypothetical protein ACRC5T_04185 [Cetobacterium sp.]
MVNVTLKISRFIDESCDSDSPNKALKVNFTHLIGDYLDGKVDEEYVLGQIEV